MRERVRLTDIRVREAKPPKSGRRELWDSEVKGLGLRVTPNGVKSYVLYQRWPDGKPSRRKIGDASEMSVDEARAIALRWRAWTAQGIDPREIERELMAEFRLGKLKR